MAETLRLLLLLLAGVQALVMLWDELFFHRRRGLERFERWGHVADTAVFCAALCIPAFAAPDRVPLISFVLLAFFSSLLITKDEWIHAKVCTGAENWCHALLFILHGALLVIVGILWVLEPDAWELRALPFLVLAWGLYQHFYWNLYHVRSGYK